MKNIFLKFILIILLFSCFEMNAQGFLRAEGKQIVNEAGDPVILRGMGLGGWMVQEGYMLQTASFANPQWQIREKITELIGEADTEEFYEAWLANHCRKSDIDSLKSWGFNSVRLPMHYNLFTLSIQDEPVQGQNTWLDKGFELTDSLISWCAQNEMYVILDLHAAPGGQGYDQGISDYNPEFPSLWESQENRDKTVALWRRIAERYADEPWVGAYDLLNEPNWNLPGGNQLRALYNQIVAQIRQVDTKHLVIIEGNWFANDFTGLTPPWDDNMAYGPHKYWSYNNPADIQWVLTIRDQFDVPLYFGESGENSNTWFRDAIKLIEDHEIGWAWWPMKKVESISGPLSVIKSPSYQTLLNYWENGGSQPSAAFAKATLMQLADNLKTENCVFQKDVVDAMFRQVQSDEAIPYNDIQDIPGIVYAADFDMGVNGSAYVDNTLATYHVSGADFTAWNAGWAYRNDGVDIEKSNDFTNSNGFNVGFTEEGEWIQYSVNVSESAVYDIEMRMASGGTTGKFHFSANGSDISPVRFAPNTGGWQSWQTVTIPNIILSPSDTKLRFHCDGDGVNVGSFEFVKKAETNTMDAVFVSAFTTGQDMVQVNFNKPMDNSLPALPANFEIFVNGSSIPITDISVNAENSRILKFTVNHTFKTGEIIKISYSGNQVLAADGTALQTFTLEDVLNNSTFYHPVPGLVQAEDFFTMSGIQLEMTTDAGGGYNIGYLDVGDYADYLIDVSKTGPYEVLYRTASDGNTGQVQMFKVDPDGTETLWQTATFAPTGGWQNWATTSKPVYLFEGQYHIRLKITQPQFNINWFDFVSLTPTTEAEYFSDLNIYPNPTDSYVILEGELHNSDNLTLQVTNILGQTLFVKNLNRVSGFRERLDISAYPDGQYFVVILTESGERFTRKILKK